MTTGFSGCYGTRSYSSGVTATAADDAVLTPSAGPRRPMSGVELNAHIYAGVIEERLIEPLASAWQMTLTVVLCLLAPLLLPRIHPRSSLVTTLVLSGVPILLCLCALLMQRWFAPLSAALASLLTYPLWSWRRLDYTFRYLRTDLALLDVEAEQLPVDVTDPNLAESLAFLMRLYDLDGWGVYRDDRELHREGDAPLSPQQVARVGEWEQHDDSLWIRCVDGAVVTTIGVFGTAATLRSDSLRATLQRVVAGLIDHGPRRRGAYEVIGVLLRRLGRTAARVRMLRRVVADSMANMGDGMLLVDGFGRIVLANDNAASLAAGPGAAPLTGMALDSALSRVVLSGGDTWRNVARRALVAGERVELDAAAPGDRSLLVHASAVDLGPPVGPSMIVNLVDITALRQAERQRSETLAFLSHDLRSPMVSLLALVNRHRSGERAPDAELLNRVEHYARRNLDASDRFLQLARLQSAENVEFYDFEVTDVLSNAAEQVYFQAEEKHVDVDVVFGAGSEDGVWLNGNAELLERALVNLIDNAIKYSPPDSRVVASATVNDGELTLAVADRGHGIADEDRDALFKAFYRVPGASSRHERGAGLGLPFVKAVAERHAGRVDLDSEPGEGSTFRIVLPLDPAI